MTRPLTADRGMALIRMGVGLYFVVQAYDKTRRHWLTDGQLLTRYLQPQLPHAEGWYRHFLENTVLPHAALFARLVTLGEWAVGLSLLLGVLAPLGALGGTWLVLNYMLTKGLGNIAGSLDRLMFLLCLVFLLTTAGPVWSLAGTLGRLVPHGSARRRLAGSGPLAHLR
jgi:uncharacterized membrane protein YphA (DoxX/SURF4 family)